MAGTSPARQDRRSAPTARSSWRSATGQRGPSTYSNSIVALEPKTLKLKDSFTQPGADFNASPVIFRYKDKDLMAVSGNDGRLYLLDGTSLKTPLHVTPKYSNAGATGGLATWESDGTRWILAPAVGAAQAGMKVAANGPVTSGSIVAFKLVDEGGKLSLEPAWASRDLTSPAAPLVFNGVVFALSTGEHRPANCHRDGGRASQELRFRRCSTHSIQPRARSCGRAGKRSPRSRVGDSRPPRVRCISSRSTILSMRLEYRWSTDSRQSAVFSRSSVLWLPLVRRKISTLRHGITSHAHVRHRRPHARIRAWTGHAGGGSASGWGRKGRGPQGLRFLPPSGAVGVGAPDARGLGGSDRRHDQARREGH